MNRKEFVDALAKKSGYTRKELNEVLLPAIESVFMEEVLEAGGCTFNGFGKFIVRRKQGKAGVVNGREYDNSDKVTTTITCKIPVKEK